MNYAWRGFIGWDKLNEKHKKLSHDVLIGKITVDKYKAKMDVLYRYYVQKNEDANPHDGEHQHYMSVLNQG